MKVFLTLLICSSLVFAKPTNNNLKKNFFNLIGESNLALFSTEHCDYCIKNYDQLHESFQDPLVKAFLLSAARQKCQDEECFEKIKAYIDAVATETDSKKGCKIVCEESTKELINDSQKETIMFNFPNVAKNLMSIWDKISCSQCHKYHKFLHEAFKNAAFREYYLATGRQLCPTKDCVKKLEALVKSITKETEERKACKPVCDIKKDKEDQEDQSRETIMFNFPNVAQNFSSIWDKIACSQCHKYHSFLHEAFKNAAFREYYLATGRQLCIDNDCVKKLEALVKAITKETEEKKACKPVCDF